MLRPVLPFHHEGKTIYPIGNWIGWYFSEEMYNANKYGYIFNIIKGYTFNKGNSFSGYVKHMYDLRIKYLK